MTYEIKQQPAGFGREQFVVYDGEVRVAAADDELSAQVIAMTKELSTK